MALGRQTVTKTSYIVLGFAAEQNGPVHPLCVLSWLGDAVPSFGLTLHLSKNWQENIPDHFASYVAQLIEDWWQLSVEDPNALIQMLGELSVGPIRTLEEGCAPSGALQDILIMYLGHGAT